MPFEKLVREVMHPLDRYPVLQAEHTVREALRRVRRSQAQGLFPHLIVAGDDDRGAAVIQGVMPAVIGVMAIAILRMWRSAAPDPLATLVLVATVAVLHLSRVTPMKAMLGGAVVGVLRSRWLAAAGRL